MTGTTIAGFSADWRKAWATPWLRNSQESKTTRPARAASTTGGKNRGLNSEATRIDARSGMIALRNLRARRGSGLSIFGLEPSAAASTPRGRSLSSTRVRTLSALTVRPKRSLTAAAMASSSRSPSHSSATRYSRGVSWITCPSPRRARAGGCL